MNERDKATEQHKSRIPEFVSREEEAEFWDTHDFTDYLDELEPVRALILSLYPQSLQYTPPSPSTAE